MITGSPGATPTPAEGHPFARIARLLRTVRYLRPRQVIYRMVHRGPGRRVEHALLGPPWRRLARYLRRTAAVTSDDRHATTPTGTFATVDRSVSARVSHDRFAGAPEPPALLTADGLLTVDGVVAAEDPLRWAEEPETSRFRLYRLHSHLHLSATTTDPDRGYRFIERSIDLYAPSSTASSGPPPPSIAIAWEPHPLSLRIINWIRWASRATSQGRELPPRFGSVLAFQARYLTGHIEYETDGNHLIDNAAALVLAGSYLQGKHGLRSYLRGLRLFFQELPRQLLPDGYHDERSAMYHRLMVERVLDVIAVTGADGEARGWARSMLAALTTAGVVPTVNDHFPGMAPSQTDLFKYAASLGIEIDDRAEIPRDTADGRISPRRVTLYRAPFRVYFDTDEIGPDHVPGHAHADTLQVLLWYQDQPIFVDTGTSTYDPGPRRNYERGTSAHNTVMINGEDSSEMWGSFRVGRRARVVSCNTIVDTAQLWHCEAVHDGYRARGALHRRAVAVSPERVVVTDRLEPVRRTSVPTTGAAPAAASVPTATAPAAGASLPNASAPAAAASVPTAGAPNRAYWHLAPEVAGSLRRISASRVALAGLEIEFRDATKFDIQECEIAAGFEKRVETVRIVVEFERSLETIIEPAD